MYLNRITMGVMVAMLLGIVSCGGEPENPVDEYARTVCGVPNMDELRRSTWGEAVGILDAAREAVDVTPPEELTAFHEGNIAFIGAMRDAAAQQTPEESVHVTVLLTSRDPLITGLELIEIMAGLDADLLATLSKHGCGAE